MGIQELEWIDVGDGADGHSTRGQGQRRQTASDDRQPRRREEQQMPEEEIQRQRAAIERRQQMLAQRRQNMSIDNRIERPDPSEMDSVPAKNTIAVPRKKSPQKERIRRQKRRRQMRIVKSMLLATTFLMIIGGLFGIAIMINYIYGKVNADREKGQTAARVFVEEQTLPQDIREWGQFYAAQLEQPELVVDLLTVNEYSRPGEALPEVKNIFVHYTANAGTTAWQNKSYFQSLAETHERSASAHFIIGYDGVIVQCIPTAEIAYAVKERNYDSISIECCFLDESGEFTQSTYDSLIELTAWLLYKYELTPEDVWRHYDEGGKNCPKYYVEHEDAWRKFLRDLEFYMERVTLNTL